MITNENIVVIQADKGGSVVIIEIFQYDNKMSEILNDTETYEKRSARCIEELGETFSSRPDGGGPKQPLPLLFP